jgi:hypothetical protein
MISACGNAFAAGPMRPVTHIRGEVRRVIAAVPGAATLYDQNSDDAGVAVISEDFSHGFDSFDSYGADDFTVPAGHKWRIREVEVSGAYGQQSEPAQSEDVVFYKDKKGLPGMLMAQCLQLSGTDKMGSFAIKLPRSCKVNLSGGKRYWVSVVANESNECCTNWGWETRNTQDGKPAAWENPNGGFLVGCETWGVMTSCVSPEGEGADFMFALKGTDSVVD